MSSVALVGGSVADAAVTTTGVKLSQGKPVKASSEGGSGFAAKFAVDGRTGTRWASVRKSDPQWIYVDLGQLATIDRVRLQWDTSCAKAYRVETSEDATSWLPNFTTTTGNGGIDDLAVTAIGRYVRVFGTVRCRASGGYSLREFEVYGRFGEPERLDPPTNLRAVRIGDDGCVDLTWTPSANPNVVAYEVFDDGQLRGRTTVPRITICGLAPGPHGFYVLAVDAFGNVSEPSEHLLVVVPPRCAMVICSVTVVATHLGVPWGLAELPDGSALFTDRDNHQVFHLTRAGVETSAGTVPNVSTTNGHGGLMGLALATTFASDHWVYLFHSSPTDNRIVRIKYENGSLVNSTEQVLVTGIPRNHFNDGGRLRFGPDGKLYAGTGDAQNAANAQNLDSRAGKILRLNPDGSIPTDNPFPNSYVWTYGHRNAQGLAFDRAGQFWAAEMGASVMDEIDLIVKLGNYGWPLCEGTSGGGCADPHLVAPKQTFNTQAASPGGLAIVGNTMFMAALRGARLYYMPLSGTTIGTPVPTLIGTYGRLRTVEPTGDGGLWLTTSNGDGSIVPSENRILLIRLGNV
jgi:glucose/arabinose dehydrogenase